MKPFKPNDPLGVRLRAPKHTSRVEASRGGAWQSTSLAYRRAHPICQRCQKVASREVHHRKPLSEGGNLHDWGNLEALCIPCHKAEHERGT